MTTHLEARLAEEGRIDSCIAWMLTQPELTGSVYAGEAFLANATPESMERWTGCGNALLLGVDPEDGGYETANRGTVIGSYPQHIFHLGTEPTYRRELMATTLEYAQSIAVDHPDRLLAGSAFYALGLKFQQPFGDANGREARRFWASIGHGIEPRAIRWYQRLLREGTGNKIINPHQHVFDRFGLTARHSGYVRAMEALGVGMDRLPTGVLPLPLPNQPPNETNTMLYELYRRSKEVTYGMPTLLRFIHDSGRNVHSYITDDGRIDARRLAGDVEDGDLDLLIASGEYCKADFVRRLGACFLGHDNVIFGDISQVLRDFEHSGGRDY